jgi:hypothetical protein
VRPNRRPPRIVGTPTQPLCGVRRRVAWGRAGRPTRQERGPAMRKGLPADFAGQALHRFLRRFVSRDRRAFKLRIQIHASQPHSCRPDDSILTFSSPVCQLERRAATAPGRGQGRLQMSPVMPTALACAALLALPFVPLLAQDVDPRVTAIDRALTAAESEDLCGVVLLRSQDRVLLHSAYGFADREEKRPMTTSEHVRYPGRLLRRRARRQERNHADGDPHPHVRDA